MRIGTNAWEHREGSLVTFLRGIQMWLDLQTSSPPEFPRREEFAVGWEEIGPPVS